MKNRCAICGGTKKEGKTMFSTDLGFGVVVIRDVPAFVCGQCGEAWYDDDTTEKIEEIVQQAKEHESQVEVLQFDKSVVASG